MFSSQFCLCSFYANPIIVSVNAFTCCIFVLTCIGGVGPDCTSGFMTLDRIHTLMDRGDIIELTITSQYEALVPGMNFTCTGSIHSWIYGAGWGWGDIHDEFTELQIWRSSGNGSYNKVGSTRIMKTNTTQLYEGIQLYQYPLSSPLPFQEGDILGFYIPSGSRSQLRLSLEFRYGHRTYYTIDANSSRASHLSMDHLLESTAKYHPLISAKTGIKSL